MKYIKVSEEGKPSIVILAANKVYYLSKGAKITEPTQEEIAEFFPEEKKKEKKDIQSENIVENEALRTRITELETENEALKAENEMLKARITELETEKPKTNKGKEDK